MVRDAELLARAVVAVVRDGADEAEALDGYHRTRNRVSTELFGATDSIASDRWDAAEIRSLLLRMSSAMTDEVELLASLPDVPVVALAS